MEAVVQRAPFVERSTNCRPTLEPWRTGLTTSGGSKREAKGSLRIADDDVTWRGNAGLEAALLGETLSKAMRLDSASQPV